MKLQCASALIIGDVGGEFESLQQLIAKSPPAEKIILLGDLNDRGPHSDKVIQWAMDNSPLFNGNVITLDSNHGHMMVDFYHGIEIYHPRDFLNNGGGTTLSSYGVYQGMKYHEATAMMKVEHIAFLSSRPKYVIINDEILCTHAPLHPDLTLAQAAALSGQHEHSLLWNRVPPVPLKEYKLQVYGHNSTWNEHRNKDGMWGICIDNSRRGELMSYHYPSTLVTRDIFNFKDWHGGRYVP